MLVKFARVLLSVAARYTPKAFGFQKEADLDLPAWEWDIPDLDLLHAGRVTFPATGKSIGINMATLQAVGGSGSAGVTTQNLDGIDSDAVGINAGAIKMILIRRMKATSGDIECVVTDEDSADALRCICQDDSLQLFTFPEGYSRKGVMVVSSVGTWPHAGSIEFYFFGADGPPSDI